MTLKEILFLSSYSLIEALTCLTTNPESGGNKMADLHLQGYTYIQL